MAIKVGVIGLGFVGLTVALGLARKGHQVSGYDISETRRSALRQGHIPFYEPSLPAQLRDLSGRQFHLADDMAAAVENAEVVIFCVGTPSHPDGSVDLSYISAAIEQALACVPRHGFRTFCIKSSVPPSVCKEQLLPLIAPYRRFIGLSNNPEFLREGTSWQDFMEQDRIVIGAEDRKSAALLRQLYQVFDSPLYEVSLSEAEFIKYLSNSLLATMISFANEMSMLAHKTGDINISRAFSVLHQDKRWRGTPAGMSAYVYPGCGFGGYCLPKDLQSLTRLGKSKGAPLPLLSAVNQVNQNIADFWTDKITAEAPPQEKIAWLGLSYKPDTSDARVTPVVSLLSKLLGLGYRHIEVYDPMAMPDFQALNPDMNISYADSLDDCLQSATTVILATAWKEFTAQRERLGSYRLFDLRYCLNEQKAEK